GSMTDDLELDDGESRRRATFVMSLREDGAPDPALGGGDGCITGPEGVETVSYDVPGNPFSGVAVRPDGKILTARRGAVYRFNADGTPDTTFGSGGAAQVTLPPGAGTFNPSVLALVPGASGDVVVTGAVAPIVEGGAG